jgi:hypothetical protein
MAVTAALLAFIAIVLTIRVTQLEKETWVQTTWPEYVEECGTQPDSCFRKYRQKAFKGWEGHLLRVMDNRQNPRKYYQHALSLYLKM